MAGPSSDYQRGAMDIDEQQATFQLVMGMTKWGSLAIAVGVLFFVLWFCTHFGFVGAAFTSLVLLVAGVVFLRESPEPAH
jgi:hypothetical protein